MREFPKPGDMFIIPDSGYKADYCTGDRIPVYAVQSGYLYFKSKDGAVFTNGTSAYNVSYDESEKVWRESSC